MSSPAPRSVLVTGGSGYLGRHVTLRFLARGDRVHVPLYGDDDGQELLAFLRERPDGGTDRLSLHEGVDLTDPASVLELRHLVTPAGAPARIVLLNLAGGFMMAPVEDTDPAAWKDMWQRNVTTAFLAARAFFPGMKEAGWGRIVNVSAFPAIDRGKSGLAAYGAAKAAVLNLTQTLAREGVGHGITANAVLPSIIDTPPNRESMPAADRSTWLPAGEIASVLEFLASDAARIVNGSGIPLTLD